MANILTLDHKMKREQLCKTEHNKEETEATEFWIPFLLVLFNLRIYFVFLCSKIATSAKWADDILLAQRLDETLLKIPASTSYQVPEIPVI